MATFHPFPRLPAELRLAIWEFSIEPKNIEVALKTTEGDVVAPDPGHAAVAGHPPVAAHTCHEAREHLEKVYSKVTFSNSLEASHPQIWFNPSIDSIIVDQRDLNAIIATPDARLIKELTVAIKDTSKFISESLDRLRDLDQTLEILTLWFLEHERTGAEPDWNWMHTLSEVFAELYWRCNPAPFFTTSSNPDFESVHVLDKETYVHYEREDHIARVQQYGGAFSDVDGCEDYINNAHWYWFPRGWKHDGCDCKSLTVHPAQHLIDLLKDESPVDVHSLSDNWSDYAVSDEEEDEEQDEEQDDESDDDSGT